MEKRIKQVRADAGLTQEAFGERIGIKKTSVVKIERKENNPSEQTIRAICDQFGVNRLWLETGDEPMYMPQAEDDQLIDEVLAGENEFVKAVIRAIAKTPDGWETMERVFTAIQHELEKQKKSEE